MKQVSTEKIRQAIKQRVASGEWPPGCAISEAELTGEFGVSRTPVREALIQLSVQGFVQIVPRSGIFVSKLSVRQLLAMLETLAHLEGFCASLVAARIDAAGLSGVQKVHAEAGRAVEADDARLYAACNQEFHDLLYQSCRNEFLVDQIDLIRSRTAAYRLKRFDMPGGLRRSWEGHSQLIDAVVAGNRRAAHDAAVEHIEMGGREFAEMVRQLPEDVFANSSRPPAAKPPPDPMWPDVRTARAAPQAGHVPARQPKH